MRIDSIKVRNYKAFWGEHNFELGGKNLFLYGENGSGKSSLYYALKDFFQSSREPVDLAQVKNIFAARDQQAADVAVEVCFQAHDEAGKAVGQSSMFQLSTVENTTSESQDIKDALQLRGFLTYKHLLDIHYVQKGEEINLFELMVKGVLKHFRFPKGEELHELWQKVEQAVAQPHSRTKEREVQQALEHFNSLFGALFEEDHPEYVLKHTAEALEAFGQGMRLRLHYEPARVNGDCTALEGQRVVPEVEFAGELVEKPHLFLNEARLSGLAISIYLGMIKRNLQRIACKVLFLDDLFIGLDLANRLPLLDVLKDNFRDYQIILTTYDKPWYNYAKGRLDDNAWTTMELYTRQSPDGYDIPMLRRNTDLLDRANAHVAQADYKAAAVYARTAFEEMIQRYCDKRGLQVRYRLQTKRYTAEDFWRALKAEQQLDIQLCEEVERYRGLVLNPFSHFDTEGHEFGRELNDAITTLRRLDQALKEQLKLRKKG